MHVLTPEGRHSCQKPADAGVPELLGTQEGQRDRGYG